MDKWAIVHAYRHLIKDGRVDPWLCPADSTTLVTRLGKDDDPVLWCMTCGGVITPGLNMYERMLKAIREFE
jgi:hypothetical protein